MEGKDNLPIPWRSVCLLRQRHCCDFMQALSTSSQFGEAEVGCRDVAAVPWEGWWHWSLSCAICVGCGWDGILGMAFPSPASSFPGAAEWSPSVMFTHPALKSLLTSLTAWKQDTGGFYLVKVLGTVGRVRKERANTPQVSQPLLFVRLLWNSSLNANNEC